MEQLLCKTAGCIELSICCCLAGQKLGDATPGPRGMQLVWPTAEEVRLSLEGWSAGDSIPGPAKNVDRPFLQQYWHRLLRDLSVCVTVPV